MTTPFSPNDLEGLQKDILNGNVDLSQLPANVVEDLENYWGSNPQALGQQQDPAQLAALQQQRKSMADQGTFLDSPLFKPIEWVGSKLYWLYSNTVSPFVTATAIAMHDTIYGVPDAQVNKSGDYWDMIHSISPGQAIWMLGLNNKELADRGIGFDQITADERRVKAGTYSDTGSTHDLLGVKTAKEEYFDQGAAKFVTGATDLAVSWYADPLVLTGKLAGGMRTSAFKKPVASEVGRAMGDFDAVAKTPTFTKMVNTVMKYKLIDNDTAALRLRRDLPTLRRSANGDTLARLLADAKDADEVSQVLRISMGDVNGFMGLESKNMALAYQAEQASQRFTGLSTSWANQTPAWQASAHGVRIKGYIGAQETLVKKLNDQMRVIDDKLAGFASIDNMNFNRVTTPIGMKWRGAKFQDGKLREVRGQGAIKGSVNLVYNGTVGFPIKLVRSYGDIKPTSYLDVHGENSYLELQETLKEAKGISREVREKYVSDYIRATPNERTSVLMKMELDESRAILARVNAERVRAGKEEFEPAMADELYKDYASRRMSGQSAATQGRTYGAATLDDPLNPGQTYRVAEIEADGSRVVATPLFETQLANSHVLMNFKHFEDVLRSQGEMFHAARQAGRATWLGTTQVADSLGTVWKFAQLFRLGYAPRALADDFLGQVARFGAIDMAARVGSGGRSMANRLANGTWVGSSRRSAQDALKIQHEGLTGHLDDLSRQQTYARIEFEGRKASGLDTTRAQDDLTDINDEIARSQVTLSQLANSLSATSRTDRNFTHGRQVFAAPYGGATGALFRDAAAGERNFANMMGTQADWYLNRTRRGDWKNITAGTDGVEKFSQAWSRKITDQIAQSGIGRQALMGKSEGEMVHWMRSTPEGVAYRKDIGLKNMDDFELARRVKAEVDYTMNPDVMGMDVLRVQALNGQLKMEDLMASMPERAWPMVNGESFGYAAGTGTAQVAQLADRAISTYYKFANQLPATKLLRNPLFAQQYRAAITDQMKVLRKQGHTHIDETMRLKMETNARQRALRDVKSFTFTMDHETKMAYTMRNFGAFFGAQQESWNRWARIIAEKPQTLPHIAQVYGAPARTGMITDQDGNPVDGTGHITDPVTGEKRLTKYTDRKILFQIPEYLGGKKLNKALGLDEDASFTVPMSSVELVMNHGDGAIPVGAGPYVQIGVNHFAKDDPKVADWAKKLGVLPFGPQDSVLNFVNPNTGKRLGDSADDMGEVKQRALLHMMQVEHYKWENGQRDTEPTWPELMDRADRWTMFRTVMAFTLPVSVNGQDPYQYFRDEYQRMQKLDPGKADEAFHDKYGDSFYQFSQSMSKNATGIRPTAEGVKMSKYYSDLIGKVGPEYAALVVGDEGDGVFSQGAYYYQKTHSTDPASDKPDRFTLGARDAWKESQTALGWKQYGASMDEMNAQLFERGLASYDDPGAEDLKAVRSAVVKVLSEDRFPDGTENPYYNREWTEAFMSINKGKYDQRAHDLQGLVEDPEMWSKAYDEKTETVGMRSDIFTLRQYLYQRGNMNVVLAGRKAAGGSEDITADSNGDLHQSWTDFTLKLIESDTKFGRLHSRWFATDMGFNLDREQSPEQQAQAVLNPVTVAGGNQPLIGDVSGTS